MFRVQVLSVKSSDLEGHYLEANSDETLQSSYSESIVDDGNQAELQCDAEDSGEKDVDDSDAKESEDDEDIKEDLCDEVSNDAGEQVAKLDHDDGEGPPKGSSFYPVVWGLEFRQCLPLCVS